MPSKSAAIISRLGQRRQVVIPKGICDALRLEVGDFVAVERRDGDVMIRPQRVVDREEILTPTEALAVKRGGRDVAAGRTIDWNQYKKSRVVDRKSR
jgi:AbrB family looped-hinge helix DNA binding protein